VISWTQIAVAAVITGVGVALAARAVRWPTLWAVVAGIAAFALIVIWRGLSNRIGLNADFIPAVSPADVGSFVAGAIGPMATLPFVGGNRSREWLPAVVGGIVGFVANVVVL
jgi:hypothetical protein